MKNRKTILINTSDTMIITMLTAALSCDEYDIIACNGRYEEITSEIKETEPLVVLIWGVEDADKIFEYISGWWNADSKPFFIVVTSYCEVFRNLDERLPGNAFPVLEPVSADFIRKLIQKAAEGEPCFDVR